MSYEESDLECIDCINIARNSSNISPEKSNSSNFSERKETFSENKEGNNFVPGEGENSMNTNLDETNSENSELKNLINIIKRGIRKNEPGIKVIKYPELLLSSLQEMDNMIGLDNIKESVAMQTVKMIENLKKGKKSTKMLNTVLTGVQGCGKTSTGIILAKIWHALGFLDIDNSTTTTTRKTTTTGDASGYLTLIFLVLVWTGTYILSALSFAYNRLGLFWLGLILGFFLLIIILLYYNRETITKYTTIITKTQNNNSVEGKSDREIISVVSRDDFVAGYLGQTASKTKKLLEDNIGKVLFIDEAYSLLNDPRDAYGFEALNVLNMFLSENADKIIVIFAGYKEHMKATIFAAQPGLERRCMWHLQCDPYSGEQLAQIFFLKMKKEGWVFAEGKNGDLEKERIRKLIVRNEAAFKNQGGDIERLLYYVDLHASKSMLKSVTSDLLSSSAARSSSKASATRSQVLEGGDEGEGERLMKYEFVENGIVMLKENVS